MNLKRHLLTAALTLFCLSAANAQLLRTTVEQGEIEVWNMKDSPYTRESHTLKHQWATSDGKPQ